MSSIASFKLAHFRRFAREAKFGETFVYHREPADRDEALYAYARKLHEAGLVFLFTRRLDGGAFEKCARRTPVLAHLSLDRISQAIQVAPSSLKLKEAA